MIKYIILALLLCANLLPLNGMKRKRNDDNQISELIPVTKYLKENKNQQINNNNNQPIDAEHAVNMNQDSIEPQLDLARQFISLTNVKAPDALNAVAQIVIATIQRTPELSEAPQIKIVTQEMLDAIEKNNSPLILQALNKLSLLVNINQYFNYSEIAQIMVMNLDYSKNVSLVSKLSNNLGIQTLTRYLQATKEIVSPLQYVVKTPSTILQNAFKTTKALLFFAGSSKMSTNILKCTGNFFGKKILKYASENKFETATSLASFAAYSYLGAPALLIPFGFNIVWSSLGFRSLTAYGAFERDVIDIQNKRKEKLQRNRLHDFSTLELYKRDLKEFTLDTVGKQCFATDPMPLTPETQLLLADELLKHVNVINLSGNHLTNNTGSLNGFSVCTMLIFLCLSDNNLTSLEFIESMMQIKILDISNNPIDFSEASNLGALVSQKELIKLVVFNTQHPEFNLTDDAINCLVVECPILVHQNIYTSQEQYANHWKGTLQEIKALEDTQQAALAEKQKNIELNESENEQKEISSIIDEVRIYLKNDQATLYDYINTISDSKISPNDDRKKIKIVCKKLRLKYHPDKLQGLDENIIKLLNNVAPIILNEKKRALYDKMLNSQWNIID